ncbi:hypothetical protein RIF29_24899 [Crotalaria pallida]|uniref:Uncharacterized protein n=1 Tax=Crotalaria pallida TaxID=3830 RepID=A0AAN9EMT8_CROPI
MAIATASRRWKKMFPDQEERARVDDDSKAPQCIIAIHEVPSLLFPDLASRSPFRGGKRKVANRRWLDNDSR